MSQPADSHTTDPVITPYLDATDERVAHECLTALLAEQAQPIIEAIVAAKFSTITGINSGPVSTQDAGDLKSEAAFRLTRALQRLRNDPDGKRPEHFGGYVARTAYNVWNMYLRRSFPERARLKNRVRYLARRRHQHQFLMWSDPNGEVWFSFATHLPAANIGIANLITIVQEKHQSFAQDPLEDLARVVLEQAGGALRLDDLVTVIAEVWGLKDSPPQALNDAPSLITEGELDGAEKSVLQWRLTQLCAEIRELQPLQRAALLLNLRDDRGHELTTQFLFTQVITSKDLATALRVSELDLPALLKELPLDDNSIGRRLNLTRQQVINLRRCARDRLWRRLKGVLALRQSRERQR
jgi:hypothetical protein